MKNKLRKAAIYCLDHPYEIGFYAMTFLAGDALFSLYREQRKHALCHGLAQWTVRNVKTVPVGTKQHIWTDGKYWFIEAIKE